ncbi:MAG: hypothetical protein JW781_11385 [Deltaproteobacteria bacterium]|nr:hypothetical protein [Candidatus Anaeroferrophillacea bacterium]
MTGRLDLAKGCPGRCAGVLVAKKLAADGRTVGRLGLPPLVVRKGAIG